jgi:Cu(I)-responsive transcriptional regulator
MGISIGELARATGTKAETIRYYERIGLLPKPSRTAANYRSYGSAELARLSFIRRARALGFTIEQVGALLDLADNRARSCEAVDALAKEHLTAIEAKISDLSALRRELADLIGQCSRGTIADCRIIDALAPSSAGSGFRSGERQEECPR